MILISSDHHHHQYPAFATSVVDGVNNRLAQSLEVEDALFLKMRRAGVTHHLRLGDLFEKKNAVDAVVFNEVAKKLQRNQAAGIEEIILKGNHDAAAGGARNTLEALGLMGVARIISEPQCLTIGQWSFYCLPYLERGLDVALGSLIHTTTGASDASVLLAHTGVQGAKTGSEFVLSDYVKIEDLFPDKFQWVMLGHIHEPQYVHSNAFYLGSFVQRSFADEGSPRRAVLMDPHTGKLSQYRLPGPRFVTVPVATPQSLSAFTFDNMAYYRFVVPPDLDNAKKALAPYVDGRCLGWTTKPAPRPLDAAPTARLSGLHTKWEAVCHEYVKKQQTKLNKKKLMTLALELMNEEPPTL